ncbi:MAG: hypothetical protein JWN08_3697 [Frankiales bacterium]|jgi:hypothetical protein|nr:hypothetical protein [Frankiales bacterium]
MSKVDALRAMREAKYARNGAAPAANGTATPRTPLRAPAAAKAARAVAEPVEDTGELCGHRNMGGKSCSRPAGHSEKNHRYATA